jgi:hypothetical protein
MSEPATLLEAIQAAWTADAVLSDLVPDSRCYFGKVPPMASVEGPPDVEPEMPYVRIEKPGDRSAGRRSSAALYKDVTIGFHVWTDTPEQGDRIAEEIERVFSEDLAWTGGAAIDSKFVPHSTAQVGRPEISQWETVCTFTMRTWQPRTDVGS